MEGTFWLVVGVELLCGWVDLPSDGTSVASTCTSSSSVPDRTLGRSYWKDMTYKITIQLPTCTIFISCKCQTAKRNDTTEDGVNGMTWQSSNRKAWNWNGDYYTHDDNQYSYCVFDITMYFKVKAISYWRIPYTYIAYIVCSFQFLY